jgi:hypothetical protein
VLRRSRLADRRRSAICRLKLLRHRLEQDVGAINELPLTNMQAITSISISCINQVACPHPHPSPATRSSPVAQHAHS